MYLLRSRGDCDNDYDDHDHDRDGHGNDGDGDEDEDEDEVVVVVAVVVVALIVEVMMTIIMVIIMMMICTDKQSLLCMANCFNKQCWRMRRTRSVNHVHSQVNLTGCTAVHVIIIRALRSHTLGRRRALIPRHFAKQKRNIIPTMTTTATTTTATTTTTSAL